MRSEKTRVVLLCGPGQSSRMLYHGLAPYVDVLRAVVENKPPASTMIRRRIKRLGVVKTVGQVLFLLTNKLLVRTSRRRIGCLMSCYGLDDSSVPNAVVRYVETVNSEEVIALLRRLEPDAVVVNGTRILSRRVLSSVTAPFINTHMGITPKYRGVHGGYWALANGDPEHCGVTIHLVDEGIDTGGVLYQAIIHPDRRDSFNTYPIHQLAAGLPLMKRALDDVRADRIKENQGVLPSRLWYHPTLFEYLKHWVQSGVR